MLLDAYIRVSELGKRDPNDPSYRAEKEQESIIRAWAKANNHEIVMVHKDTNISGAKARPTIDLIIERTGPEGPVDGLVVAKLNRFSRMSSMKGMQLIEAITGEKGERASFFVCDFPADSSTQLGKALIFLMLAISREEWEDKVEYRQNTARAAVKEGILPNTRGNTRPGYDLGKDKKLYVNESERKAIYEAGMARAAGTSFNDIHRMLTKTLPHPKSKSGWSKSGVESMLANPVYKGEGRYGKASNPNSHEGIFTPDEWQAIQDVQRAKPIQPKGLIKLLAGLVRCDSCGYLMVSGTSGSGGKIRAFICKTNVRLRNKVCTHPTSISEAALNQIVHDFMAEHLAAWQVQWEASPRSRREKGLDQKIQAKQALLTKRQQEDNPDTDEAIAQLRSEIAQLKRRREDAQKPTVTTKQWHETMTDVERHELYEAMLDEVRVEKTHASDELSLCSEDGCDKPVQARGLCQMHYKHRKAADTLPPRKSVYGGRDRVKILLKGTGEVSKGEDSRNPRRGAPRRLAA